MGSRAARWVRLLSVVPVLPVLAVAACADGDEDAGGDPPAGVGGATTTTVAATAGPVAEVAVTDGPADVVVEVLPLVRTDDGLVLTLDVTVEDPAGDQLGPELGLGRVWQSHAGAGMPDWIGLRLVDLAGDTVAPPALDAGGDTVAAAVEDEAGERMRLQVAFGDPGTDEVAVFVPQGGLVDAVPVLDGDVPPLVPAGEGDGDGAAGPLDLGAVTSAPVVPMQSFAVDPAADARTQADAEQLTIALGTDVLFAVDSADLTPEALGVIAAAAGELVGRAPGPVTVVGHTDSTASDEYNLDLSQRRADAVAAALAAVVDPAAYPLRTEGRGEEEPIADNGSEEGRAANRRVELRVTTPVAEPDAAAESQPQPPAPFEGQTATGAAGVDVAVAGRSYRVTAPRARVVDDHLVVTLETAATDTEVGSVSGPAIYEGRFPGPPGLDRLRTMAGVAVVDGATLTLPALHRLVEAEELLAPLTDLGTFLRLDGGDTRTSELVYPRGVPVGATVTLQLVDDRTGSAWRLTDVPVDAGG